jgi:hypothetical protein
VRLRRQGDEPKLQNDEQSKSQEQAVIASDSGGFVPIILEAHSEFGADIQSCQEKLQVLFKRWDLAEPFDRLAKGLDYVHQQKVLPG